MHLTGEKGSAVRLATRFATRSSVLTAVFATISVALVIIVFVVLPSVTHREGYFTRADVAVYAESVDGWACHLVGSCRSGNRVETDPGPVYLSDHRGEPVVIECSFGAYYKIAQPRAGWVNQLDVRATAKPTGCYAGQF